MPDAQRMVIRIKKGTDGRTALSCTRADGTTTWQRQQGGQAAFFPKHDLTHYAVETTLGLRQGFYGLVSTGWDFSDFGSPWPRGKLPPEASVSEARGLAIGAATSNILGGNVGCFPCSGTPPE